MALMALMALVALVALSSLPQAQCHGPNSLDAESQSRSGTSMQQGGSRCEHGMIGMGVMENYGKI